MVIDVKIEIKNQVDILEAGDEHTVFAEQICDMIEKAAKIRGTGIAKRDPKYIIQKMLENKAIIAVLDNKPVGFCYIESWDHGKYVANSGLIVDPNLRKSGLARRIKKMAFELSRKKFPLAKIVGLTTSLPVMKINSDLGYRPVTFSEMPKEDSFWKGCSSCVNFDILNRTQRKMCLCTGMMYNPEDKQQKDKN